MVIYICVSRLTTVFRQTSARARARPLRAAAARPRDRATIDNLNTFIHEHHAYILYCIASSSPCCVYTYIYLSPRFKTSEKPVCVRAACVCGGVHTPHTCMVYTCVLLYMYIVNWMQNSTLLHALRTVGGGVVNNLNDASHLPHLAQSYLAQSFLVLHSTSCNLTEGSPRRNSTFAASIW